MEIYPAGVFIFWHGKKVAQIGVVASHLTHLLRRKHSQDYQSFSHNKYVIQEIMKKMEQLQNKGSCSLRSTLLVGFSKNRSHYIHNTLVNERIFSQTFKYMRKVHILTGEIIADIQNVFPYAMF